MISFRLTAEEYENFRKLCFSHGVRSVSEMARTAINMLLTEPEKAQQQTVECRLSELEGRLHMLAMEIRQLQDSGPRLGVREPVAVLE